MPLEDIRGLLKAGFRFRPLMPPRALTPGQRPLGAKAVAHREAHSIARLQDLALRQGRLYVTVGRASSFFSSRFVAERAARQVIAALTPGQYVHTENLMTGPADVYGVDIDGTGYYLKLYIDERAPEVVVVSLHPPEHPLRTRDGRVIQGTLGREEALARPKKGVLTEGARSAKEVLEAAREEDARVTEILPHPKSLRGFLHAEDVYEELTEGASSVWSELSRLEELLSTHVAAEGKKGQAHDHESRVWERILGQIRSLQTEAKELGDLLQLSAPTLRLLKHTRRFR